MLAPRSSAGLGVRHVVACPSRSLGSRGGTSCKASKAAMARFPLDYNEAIRQAQASVQAALGDGATLLEVEFPTASLASVQGDAEGANEMTYSLQYLRQFLRGFQQQAATTRVFFPDKKEMQLAQRGKGVEPNAGSWAIDPVFDKTPFQLDYLTNPTGLLDLGLDIGKVDVASKVRESDRLLVMAYPHFNVGEILAIEELWAGAARSRGTPIVVFNGELDRIRSGYYPPLFYPKLARLAREFLPQFTTAYYIHNFKGTNGGTLFRAYPGPAQVFCRTRDGMRLVHEQATLPSLKEVALDILPSAARRQ